MKNLWTVLQPPLSDNRGLYEIVNNSDGCAVIDDSGEFRPGGNRQWGGNRDGGEHRRGEGYEHGHGGHGSRGDREGGGRKKSRGRVIVSGVNATDVTAGTAEAMKEAFQIIANNCTPQFALFSAGPCGAMIGTDLERIAQEVGNTYHIPSASVELSGQKSYDVGLSKTTEALVNLLAKPGAVQPGSLNLMGANALDWAEEDVQTLQTKLNQQGWQVLAAPGAAVTRNQLESMGRAQINLVVTVSGLAAARWLERQFGTPYLAMAPFGETQVKTILTRLDHLDSSTADPGPEPGEAQVLILGEQFLANAVRRELRAQRIYTHIDVASFYLMDKACKQPGDRKVKGEDGARDLMNNGQYRVILADPSLRGLLERECHWIDLPQKPMTPFVSGPSVPLLGAELNRWLENQL